MGDLETWAKIGDPLEQEHRTSMNCTKVERKAEIMHSQNNTARLIQRENACEIIEK